MLGSSTSQSDRQNKVPACGGALFPDTEKRTGARVCGVYGFSVDVLTKMVYYMPGLERSS